ncbi:hypothetical protein L7F22_023168 [Adiantum nelumboides]|nr:hypothetical protein [Adiantum nelumboides]
MYSFGTRDIVLKEDFGRDRDLKTLLKTVQPEPFTGEDSDNASKLEKWIISMEDYFDLAEYNSIAKGIMGRAKIKGSAKIWWKLNCKFRTMVEIIQSWDELQLHLRECNQNGNQRIPNATHQNLNRILVKTVGNFVTITDEVTEQLHVYTTLDPSARNRHYSILEAQGNYHDKSLTFLIDSGSSHSFISPSTVKHLHLEPRSMGKKLQVSLASGSIVSCEQQIVELLFQLERHSTSQRLRVLKMEKFQGILEMDWLSKNKADIHCSQGTVSFYSLNEEQVYIHGRRRNAPLRVVKAKQMMKGLQKGLPLYVMKLNKPEKESKDKETEDREPEWLSEFSDVFLEELTGLPLTRGLVHDITLVPGAQPIAKLPYKMSLFEALELKNQLTQLLVFHPGKSKRLIIVGSITGNTNTLAGNIPPKAYLGDLRGLSGGLNGVNASPMIDHGAFDKAKAYKDSKVCNVLTMQEFHRRYHEKTGVVTLFPPFRKYITKGFVSEEESRKRIAQVVSDPSLSKSGVYWSWNNDSSSFENVLSEEASNQDKAKKVWEVSEKLVGLA